MSTLLPSLAQGFEGDAARRATLDAVLREGLPKPRSEAWKYTSLRALERRTFAPAQGAPLDAGALAHIDGPRLVFVNGLFDAQASRLDGLPSGVALQAGVADAIAPAAHADFVFAGINAAMARGGALLRVAAGTRSEVPLHLVFVGVPTGSDQAWHVRHALDIGEGADVRVVEHVFSTGAHSNLGTSTMSIALARGAQLAHVRLQEEAPGASLFAHTDAALAQDARYRRLDLELGAALSRHEFGCRLIGEGAGVQADGVLLGSGRRHVDTRLNIDHAVGNTRCDLTWRGLAADRSRAVLHGGIQIRAGADGSAAALSSKNLLLSDQAEIDAQPVLEIHADEVKAAHGATVGQLNENALFYLRSRGIDAAQARSILTAAFGRQALAPLGDSPLVEPLALRLHERLAALDAE